MKPNPTSRDHLRWMTRVAAHRILRGALRVQSHAFPSHPGGNTVVIAPHPDDETFGCGGLIALRRRAGTRVRIIYLTDGSASHPKHPTLSPDALAGRRRDEAVSAAEFLGVPADALTFLNARDGTLAHLSSSNAAALTARLAEMLAAERPDEVFLPYRQDGSSEHEAAFPLVTQAFALASVNARRFEFPIWSWWSPRLLLRALGSGRRVWRLAFPLQATAKCSALGCYRSQTEPTAPWTAPVLPRGFASFFSAPVEYYFEG